jgi:hypothetical protein
MKIIASSMKEACSERLAIWESTLEALQQQQQQQQQDNTTIEQLSLTAATATAGGENMSSSSTVLDMSNIGDGVCSTNALFGLRLFVLFQRTRQI